MGDGHMFAYDHCHRSAFIECKCNFRLALMYYKSFLFPLDGDEEIIQQILMSDPIA